MAVLARWTDWEEYIYIYMCVLELYRCLIIGLRVECRMLSLRFHPCKKIYCKDSLQNIKCENQIQVLSRMRSKGGACAHLGAILGI